MADATPSGSTNLSGIGSNAFGLYGGVKQGGAVGDTKAAASASKLAGSSGIFDSSTSSQLKGIGSGAGNVLGIYTGLKQGGVGGDASAAVNAAQLGSNLGAFGSASGAIGNAAGYAAVPLSILNEVNNWQSGATGSDALAGASSGAAIGTMIMPGVGTAVGLVFGAAAGAISSAFGSGKVDAENKPFEAYTQIYNKAPAAQQAQIAASVQNPYLPLAGYFDLRKDQLKGSNPLYQKYGRAGEQKFTQDLTSQINTAYKNGTISKTDTPQTIYSKVVSPWVNSMGNWQDSNKGAIQGLLQQMTSQYVSGSAQTNWKATGGDTPFAKLPAYAGAGQAATPTPPTVPTPTTPTGPTAQAVAPGSLAGMPTAYNPSNMMRHAN